MSLKVTHKTLSALRVLKTEHHMQTGKNITLNDVVWGLIEKCAPETAAKVNEQTNPGSVGKP